MPTRSIQVLLATSLLCLASASNFACNSSDSTTQSTHEVGVIDNNSFFIDAIVPTGVTRYLHEQSSFTKVCEVLKSETSLAKKDIFCILDISELDLYYNGLKLNYNAPQSMCKYTILDSYYYYNYEPSPTALTINVAATTDTATGLTAYSKSSGSDGLGVNPNTGAYTCTYDYTDTGGPNCCEGTANITYATNPATSTSTATYSLPGKRSNCLSGSGVEQLKKGTDGKPIPTLTKAADTGLNDVYILTAPYTKGLRSNIFLANYFLPTDRGNATDTFPAVTLPTSVVNPYYEFGCLDEAFDYVARIRILVRSWDRLDYFTSKSNPYNKPSPDNGDYGSSPYHDKSVWKDYLTTYIGSSE